MTTEPAVAATPVVDEALPATAVQDSDDVSNLEWDDQPDETASAEPEPQESLDDIPWEGTVDDEDPGTAEPEAEPWDELPAEDESAELTPAEFALDSEEEQPGAVIDEPAPLVRETGLAGSNEEGPDDTSFSSLHGPGETEGTEDPIPPMEPDDPAIDTADDPQIPEEAEIPEEFVTDDVDVGHSEANAFDLAARVAQDETVIAAAEPAVDDSVPYAPEAEPVDDSPDATAVTMGAEPAPVEAAQSPEVEEPKKRRKFLGLF
ncbi:MAG: hypothetical protein AMXMBFR84_48010 [Candidatus Hydrogenedentota bacterium]